jgi:hypothetical protein
MSNERVRVHTRRARVHAPRVTFLATYNLSTGSPRNKIFKQKRNPRKSARKARKPRAAAKPGLQLLYLSGGVVPILKVSEVDPLEFDFSTRKGATPEGEKTLAPYYTISKVTLSHSQLSTSLQVGTPQARWPNMIDRGIDPVYLRERKTNLLPSHIES